MSKVKVIVRETVVSHKDFDADECEIIVGDFRDDSSIKISVVYDNVEIYTGHLNFKSGFAHLNSFVWFLLQQLLEFYHLQTNPQ